MATFLSSLLLFSGLMLIIAIPVIAVAHRRGRISTIRNFVVGALATGAVLTIIKVASDQSVQQCVDAGNTQCVDFGSTGMAVLFIGGYTTVALGRAWVLSR